MERKKKVEYQHLVKSFQNFMKAKKKKNNNTERTGKKTTCKVITVTT